MSEEVFELINGGIARFNKEGMTLEVSESGRFDDCGVFRFRSRAEFEKALNLARGGYMPGQGNDLGLGETEA